MTAFFLEKRETTCNVQFSKTSEMQHSLTNSARYKAERLPPAISSRLKHHEFFSGGLFLSANRFCDVLLAPPCLVYLSFSKEIRANFDFFPPNTLAPPGICAGRMGRKLSASSLKVQNLDGKQIKPQRNKIIAWPYFCTQQKVLLSKIVLAQKSSSRN